MISHKLASKSLKVLSQGGLAYVIALQVVRLLRVQLDGSLYHYNL